MKKLFIILLVSGLLPIRSYGTVQTFLGVNKALNDLQDKNGKEAKNPFSPVLSVGTNFQLSTEYGFSPHLGYIHNTVASDDSYGKYKMHTLFLLYDFIWVPQNNNSFALRFGLGTFRKTITGEGGTVTIPNGSGTASATRPGKSQTSYSSTVNLGADYNINISSDYFSKMGLRFELFTYRVLSQKYRNYAFNLGTVFYF